MKKMLTPADYQGCPVWRYDRASEHYKQVLSADDLPMDLSDLCIRAVFTTPAGHILQGEVVGVDNVFSIGLSAKDEIVGINRNLRSRAKKQVERYLAMTDQGHALNFECMFPLRYESRWGSKTFVDFQGVFDLPRQVDHDENGIHPVDAARIGSGEAVTQV